MFFNILFTFLLSAVLSAQIVAGLVNHSQNPGGAGFVGHSHIDTSVHGGFVGHSHIDTPVHGGIVGHRQQVPANSAYLARFLTKRAYPSQPSSYARAHSAGSYNNFGGSNYYPRNNEASPSNYVEDEPPKPYHYSYESEDAEGVKWQKEEQRDQSGVITGSYTINAPYGVTRIVNYRADSEGFHVDIQSNEPGMVDHNPSQVNVRTFGRQY